MAKITSTAPRTAARPSDSASTQKNKHTVKKGETLNAIAQREVGGNDPKQIKAYAQKIIQANNLNSGVVKPGQEITLPRVSRETKPDSGAASTSATPAKTAPQPSTRSKSVARARMGSSESLAQQNLMSSRFSAKGSTNKTAGSEPWTTPATIKGDEPWTTPATIKGDEPWTTPATIKGDEPEE